MTYAHLSTAELEAALRLPDVGDVAKDKMRAELAGRGKAEAPAAPKSTDPRERMNQTERRMADILDMRKRQGEIVAWWYEDLKLRVGVERCFYTPDFFAQRTDGSVEIIEVKGARIEDDARVKFMAAAREHRWARWRLEQWIDGGWRTLADYAPARERAA